MEKHARLFEAEKVHILHGKSVIEARRQGVDKGTAVAALVRQKPFAGRAILFGGDDATDLDVFRILPGPGRARLFGGAQLSRRRTCFRIPARRAPMADPRRPRRVVQ